MKYQTPELTALAPAINAIQTPGNHKPMNTVIDALTGLTNDASSGYADWE